MTVEIILVPDLGGAEEVEVIEIPVKVGDSIAIDDTLVVLESEKATMELPATCSGRIVKILVQLGDIITAEGVELMEIEVSQATSDTPAREVVQEQVEEVQSSPVEPKAENTLPKSKPEATPGIEGVGSGEPDEGMSKPSLPGRSSGEQSGADIYAGPYVRRLARELGVDLKKVMGSGPRQRILKQDVQNFIKQKIKTTAGGSPAGTGSAIPAVPEVDHARFGDVDVQAMSKIAKITAANMHRSWLNVPHVTQFDDADISELEEFRRSLKADSETRGIKITPVPFLLKACALALQDNPVLNRSLHGDGESFIQKNYYHVGMAVDTPKGLVVPVVRDVNQKGIWELAADIAELADKARSGKLSVKEMQGGCFTVSSLGAIGGRGFTPIVNTPEVAILGVSKAAIQPVWNGSEFAPRKLLPLSLSYDHRAINGGDAGRFLTRLVALLSDIRQLVM